MLCSLWKLPTVCLYNIFKCLINFKDCTSMHEYFSNRFVCLALYSTQWTLAVAHKCVIICSCMIKIIVLLAVYITGSTRPMENNNNNKNIDIVLRKKNFCDYNPFLHWAYEKFERKKIPVRVDCMSFIVKSIHHRLGSKQGKTVQEASSMVKWATSCSPC